jgi:haloalkane dehalogenase
MAQLTTPATRYPKWLDRNEYPFPNHYFQTPIGRMHYVDEGKGDPIVMVHGNPGWSFEFRKVIKELSKTNRCIAPDHIGFGLSDKPPEWDYLPKSQAENFERFLDHLNLTNLTLTFNDWGGPIGFSYAIKHPEKIKKFVIMNTWLWSVKDDRYYQMFSGMMGGTLGKFMIRRFNIFGKVVVKMAMGDKSKLTKAIHRHYYLHLEKPEDRKGCYVFPREIIGSSAWLDSLWQQREKINNLPATLVWGMKDIAFREPQLNYWIANWNNPRVVKLANVGHYPHEEAPEEVIKALQEK